MKTFAEHIIHLLKDNALSSNMGEAGRAVAANYDWKKITDKLEEDYLVFYLKVSK